MAVAHIEPVSFTTVEGTQVADVFIARLTKVPAENPEDPIAYKVTYRTEPNAANQIAWVDHSTYEALHTYDMQNMAAIVAEAEALE